MKYVFMIAAFTAMSTVTKGQNFAIRTFPLQTPANEMAEQLAQFCAEGETIERTNSTESGKQVFQLVPCDEGAFKIYLLAFDAEGIRKGCYCPSLTLYQGHSGYMTDYTPEDGQEYSEEETARQKEVLQKALAYLR